MSDVSGGGAHTKESKPMSAKESYREMQMRHAFDNVTFNITDAANIIQTFDDESAAAEHTDTDKLWDDVIPQVRQKLTDAKAEALAFTHMPRTPTEAAINVGILDRIKKTIHEAEQELADDPENFGPINCAGEMLALLKEVVELPVSKRPTVYIGLGEIGRLEYVNNPPESGVNVETWDMSTSARQAGPVSYSEGGTPYVGRLWEPGGPDEGVKPFERDDREEEEDDE